MRRQGLLPRGSTPPGQAGTSVFEDSHGKKQQIEPEGLRAHAVSLDQWLWKKAFLWRSASLRACLRQQGGVVSARLAARLKSCPYTKLCARLKAVLFHGGGKLVP